MHAATHCHALPHAATHCHTLQYTATYTRRQICCNTLHYTAELCYTLPTHCNTRKNMKHCNYKPMQYTALHCNTHCYSLQHTATRCIPLQSTLSLFRCFFLFVSLSLTQEHILALFVSSSLSFLTSLPFSIALPFCLFLYASLSLVRFLFFSLTHSLSTSIPLSVARH